MDSLDDPRLLRFVAAARSYRAVIDDLALKDRELLRALFYPLAELYAASIGVEGVELEDSGTDVELELQWNEMPAHVDMYRLSERIGGDACYWTLFDPSTATHDEQPVAGLMGDDLADIYRDVVPGLRGWEHDTKKYGPTALFLWRTLFYVHWGHHLLDALSVIHPVGLREGWGFP